METIACKALKAFTQFVPDYGQVHGDPENSSKDAQKPLVPVTLVAALAEQGLIEMPKGFKVEEEAAEPVEEQAPA
jgi:hypothetical protein